MQEGTTGEEETVVRDSTGWHENFIPILLLSRTPPKPPLPWGVIVAFLLVFMTIVALFSEKAIRDKKDTTQSGTIDVVFDQPKPPPPAPPIQPPPQPPQILDPPPTPQATDIPPPTPMPKPPPPTKWLPPSTRIPKKMTPPPPKPAPAAARPMPKATNNPSKLAKNDGPAEHSGDNPKGKQLSCSAPPMSYPSSARHAHEEGIAIAEIELNKDGSIMQAGLVRRTGYPDLDSQALATIKNLHCTPPPDGQPMIGHIPMEFNISRR